MPNHITNLVTFTGPEDVIARLMTNAIVPREDGKGERWTLGAFVPMPDSVKATDRGISSSLNAGGDWTIMARAQAMLSENKFNPHGCVMRHIPTYVRSWHQLADWIDVNWPDAEKEARKALLAAAETGYPGWYSWSNANWGTKWDAYQFKRVSSNCVRFQTAWAPPCPVFDAMAAQYPELTFTVESIDEGGGAYYGTYHGTGEMVEVEQTDELYARVYGHERPKYDDEPEGEVP
jgi:hypothetical protein